MRKKRFLNLLNLHLDAEISPSDAAELERAIATNGELRRIYEEYRRLNQATRLVYARFQTAASLHGEPAMRGIQRSLQGPVIELPRGRARRFPWRRITIWGSMAAACALVLGGFLVVEERSAAPIVAAESAPVAALPQPDEPASFAGASSVSVRVDPYLPVVPVDQLAALPAVVKGVEPASVVSGGETPVMTSADLSPAGAQPAVAEEPRAFPRPSVVVPVAFEPGGGETHR